VQFGLQFETSDAAPATADAEAPAAPLPATSALPAPSKEAKEEEPAKPTEGAEVVRLDRFRKK